MYKTFHNKLDFEHIINTVILYYHAQVPWTRYIVIKNQNSNTCTDNKNIQEGKK